MSIREPFVATAGSTDAACARSWFAEMTAISSFERLGDGPMIPHGRSWRIGKSVCGPSLVRVPPWAYPRLGSYYMYFAHHRGRTIRMAAAETLTGPWRLLRPPLSLPDTPYRDHIASPDVVIDNGAREFHLYYHGGESPDLATHSESLAVSSDGLHFEHHVAHLGPPYWRVFRHAGLWYGLVMPGRLFRSHSGVQGFHEGPTILGASTRHSAVIVVAPQRALIFFSRIGDAPEHIRMAGVSLDGDWRTWRAEHVGPVLCPRGFGEGAHLPVTPSRSGAPTEPQQELRDPSALADGQYLYLAYAAGGERGIGMARARLGELISCHSEEWRTP